MLCSVCKVHAFTFDEQFGEVSGLINSRGHVSCCYTSNVIDNLDRKCLNKCNSCGNIDGNLIVCSHSSQCKSRIHFICLLKRQFPYKITRTGLKFDCDLIQRDKNVLLIQGLNQPLISDPIVLLSGYEQQFKDLTVLQTNIARTMVEATFNQINDCV